MFLTYTESDILINEENELHSLRNTQMCIKD
jgi:hypothetical protein